MLLLGFGHKARHGKDSAAHAIQNFYNEGNKYRVYSGFPPIKTGIFKFATALYTEVNEFLRSSKSNWAGLAVPGRAGTSTKGPGDWITYTEALTIPDWVTPDPNPEVSDLAPYGKHPKLLQWWGTDFRRNNFGQDYWVKRMFSSIPAGLDIAMITDVRFPNEAESVEGRGGYTIKVTRLDREGSPFVDPSRSADHPSETALDAWNWNFRITTPEGHAALTGEQAITLTEYLRNLKK
jgi:hypothetical protein